MEKMQLGLNIGLRLTVYALISCSRGEVCPATAILYLGISEISIKIIGISEIYMNAQYFIAFFVQFMEGGNEANSNDGFSICTRLLTWTAASWGKTCAMSGKANSAFGSHFWCWWLSIYVCCCLTFLIRMSDT